jgi:hypothetical protein
MSKLSCRIIAVPAAIGGIRSKVVRESMEQINVLREFASIK